ncbi:MAG: phospholipase D family protein [Bryobacteraceae bacterium]
MSVLFPRLITGAWHTTLTSFVRETRQELLVASPWITEGVARFIAGSLAPLPPCTVQIMARLDEADFLNGSSHVASFRKETYPQHHRVIFRALPMLHAKMLVGDRRRVILGSANLTDGGLYRNHELSLQVDSCEVGDVCAQEFFRLWAHACDVPTDYLETMERTLAEALPAPDEEITAPKSIRRSQGVARFKKRVRFGYQSPTGASAARRVITEALSLPPARFPIQEPETTALAWLDRELRFLALEERHSPEIVRRLECLMYHTDISVRATAVDRAGRSGNRDYLPRLEALVTNPSEPREVRSAAAFALALLGSPESFSTLSAIIPEGGDCGRWARRGCFLLITCVSDDSAYWLLKDLGVADPVGVMALARDCEVGDGTVSERLTKALLVEQLATGLWTEQEVEQLVSVMTLTASALQKAGKKVPVGAVVKYSAAALRVAPGDLRHGPLSPKLLTKAAESGIRDAGLTRLIGDTWARSVASPAKAKHALTADTVTQEIIDLLA